MATIPTSIGPIGARQINHNLYVGQSDLTTIQSAVTAAAKIGGAFLVIIPFDYAGTDLIGAVTGGTNGIEIIDQRQGAWQGWRWSGAAFVPANFGQLRGFIAQGLTQPAAATMQMGFDPAGTSGISGTTGTGYLLATANAGTGVPSFQLQSQRSDGGPLYTFMRCDLDRIGEFRIQMNQVLELNNDAANLNLWAGQSRDTDSSQGFYIWAQPSLNLIDLQSETVGHPFRPAIAINRLGGDVDIALLGTTTAGNIEAQNLTVDGDIVTQTCEVDGSPVRTFANTGDAPAGMIWPPIGIAVSAGATWGTSINPATLTTYPPAGIPQSTGSAWGSSIAASSVATWPAAGIAVSTGTAWSAPISVASLATWPGAGVPVSTGAAWGASIAAANIPLLNVANIFTANQTIPSISTASAALRLISRGTGNTGTANINADAATLALNPGSAGAVWLSCDQGVGTRFGNAAGGYVGSVDISGNVTFNGQLTVISQAATQKIQLGGVDNGTTCIRSDGTHTFIDAQSGNLQLNVTRTGTPQVIVNGTIFANGAITSGASKSFRIKHPLKDDKDLVHACVEGPEIAVFYRGEGATDGGWAEITLPDYFEALTLARDRTVMLTALFEDDAEPISALAASRVKDGKFRVWSGAVTQKFYWEVKAVRGDLAPLEVEPQHSEPRASVRPEGEEADDEGTERTGASEDREL